MQRLEDLDDTHGFNSEVTNGLRYQFEGLWDWLRRPAFIDYHSQSEAEVQRRKARKALPLRPPIQIYRRRRRPRTRTATSGNCDFGDRPAQAAGQTDWLWALAP